MLIKNSGFPLILINFLISFVVVSVNSDSPRVKILNGQLLGKILLSRNEQEYFAFLGIPYGQAKRFEVAKFPENWNIVRNATSFGSDCIQSDLITKEIFGSENCLYLNVYTPKLRSYEDEKMDLLPVMIWLHGGGFTYGSGNQHGAKYFMDQNIILVTLNYRLGLFGFLDTQDGIVPGNLGLKDQNLALKWVKMNIKAFGGDPSKVILFGSSSGASSINLHMFSHLSKDLFHGAISQSGSALGGWVIQVNPAENAKKLAEFVSCPTTNTIKMVNCLKTKDAFELSRVTQKFRTVKSEFDLSFTFTPSVEVQSGEHNNSFLTSHPINLYKKREYYPKIPWLCGFNSNEGVLNLGPITNKKDLLIELSTNWSEIAPWMLVYKNKIEDSKLTEVGKQIWDFYIGANVTLITEENWQDLTDIVSDRWNTHSIIKSIDKARKHSIVYPYYFSFTGIFSYPLGFWGIQNTTGAGHLDELQYLFDGYLGAPEYSNFTKIRTFSEKLIELWVSFAEKGSFNNVWKSGSPKLSPLSSNGPLDFYEINENNLTLISNPVHSLRLKFWDSLPWIFPHENTDEISHGQEL